MRGIVVSDKTAKTVTVQVERRFRHPRYHKMVRQNSRIAAHDEKGDARVGDTVEIMECRPMSRTKHWRLVRVLQRGVEQQAAEETAPPTAGQTEDAEAS